MKLHERRLRLFMIVRGFNKGVLRFLSDSDKGIGFHQWGWFASLVACEVRTVALGCSEPMHGGQSR